MDFAAGLHLYPQSTVHHECEQGQYSDQNGVPVEDAGFVSEAEIGPQRLEEITARIQWHTAHHVAERRPEKNREQQAGRTAHKIPTRTPHGAPPPIPEFDGCSAE